MGKLEEIGEVLASTGLPVAYAHFPEDDPPDLPFLVYQFAYTNNFAADGVTYAGFDHIQIDLFSRFKDTDAEDRVEKALSSYFWEKEEEYNDAEDAYRVTYEIEV